MKKFLLLIFASLVSSGLLWAQQTVTGTVTDVSDGSALPGVNILEKGTTNGTVTDIDGNYTLNVSSGTTLVFSYVGYVTQEEELSGRTTINIALTADVTQLSEVVVVGYGTQEKKEITSAVASVGPEEFNKGNISDPAQLLQGKVAGLSITRPGGDPNGGFNIRLRGVSTFGANSSPLIVIDGVIGASLDAVDPNDIASIDVLKDGSAAAIYGARGSSGVILITTKTGKGSGQIPSTTINLNTFVTMDEVANTIDVLSSDQFVAQGGEDFGSHTDWIDELTQTAYSYGTNLSVSGAVSATTNYRASLNYRNNDGVAKGVDNERVNTSFSMNQSALDGKLRFGFNFATNKRDQNSINFAAFRYAVIYNPTAPIFDSDEESAGDGGYFQRNLFDFYNPVALANQQRFVGERQNILGSGRVEYDVLDNLTVAVNYSQNLQRGTDGSFWSKNDVQFGSGGHGIARKTQYDNFTEILSGTANWNIEVIDDLNMTLLVGAETQKVNNEGFGVQVRNFLFDEQGFDNLGFASIRTGGNTDVYSYRETSTLNSGFARANFNFDNTYFLSASVRAETYSGFGDNEKTGYFPAVSAGVDFASLFDTGVASTLKLRASYGVTGNLPPSPYFALPYFTPGARVDLDGDPLTTADLFVSPVLSSNANPTLKWETKDEVDVGVDFGFFDDRLTGTIDYYRRNITDLLYNVNVPIGAPNPFVTDGTSNVSTNTWANIAELSQGGFEFLLSYNNIDLGGVTWTPTLNFTVYDKTVIENFSVYDYNFAEIRLAAPGSPGQNNNSIIRNKVGETLGNMYGPEFLGIDEQGNYVLSSVNPEDWGIIGNGLPDGEFGFANTFTYKNWDLTFFLRGVFGHDLYNSYRGFYEPRDAASKTWNSVNTDKADPRITGTPTFSSLYVEDATFIRLDNAQIGYNLPLTGGPFSSVKFYLAGQNLFTITDYTGIDPEARYADSENGDGFQKSLAPGIERRNTYFTTRSLTFGVNVSLK